MKKLIFICTLALFHFSNAQQQINGCNRIYKVTLLNKPQCNPYLALGTWEYTYPLSGNRFIINIYYNGKGNHSDMFAGDYTLKDNQGNLVYSSILDRDRPYEKIIFGGGFGGMMRPVDEGFGGPIGDGSYNWNNGTVEYGTPGINWIYKPGSLVLKILNTNATPLQMSFEIFPTEGIKSSEEPANFNMPTNLVLTKISDDPQFEY